MRCRFISCAALFHLGICSSILFGQNPPPALIAPNAQTALVADAVFTFRDPMILSPNQILVFELRGAYISALAQLKVSSDSFTWSDFPDYGYAQKGTSLYAVSVSVDRNRITMSCGNPMRPFVAYSVRISGLRINAFPSTHGYDPGTPITMAAILKVPNSETILSEIVVATFADPVDLTLLEDPSYTWSDGLWHVRAILRISEAGSFHSAFETQSIGMSEDATQLLVTIWGMPSRALLKSAHIASTTSPSTKVALSQAAVFPMKGSPITFALNILGQDPGIKENVDIDLAFDIPGTEGMLPIASVDATVSLGPEAPEDAGKPIPFDPIPGARIGGNRYALNPVSPTQIINIVEWPMESVQIGLGPGGAGAFKTAGRATRPWVGYATFARNSGPQPYGTAVISFKQDGVTVSEVGVPATNPTRRAMIFVDQRSHVEAIPGRTLGGTVHIRTGVAIQNNGSTAASVIYTLRDLDGNVLTEGRGVLAARSHFAQFIDQLQETAPGFHLPENFERTIRFGSLEIASDQPLSVLALRATTNQRNEFLVTTIPIGDLTRPLSYDPIYFPQVADGGGYASSLILMNCSDRTATGSVHFLDNSGAPLAIAQAGGSAESSFRYSIRPRAALWLQSNGAHDHVRTGWAELVPDLYSPAPVGSGIILYNPAGVLVSQVGIPATPATLHARIYVDLSKNHNTGLAVANIGDIPADISVRAYRTDGVTNVGSGSLRLPSRGHDARFANQLVADLPDGFKGVLDIQSTTAFAALTLRSLINERGDFLMTAFPVANAARAVPMPIVFPQVVDGGNYETEFILISTGRPSSGTLSFYDGYGSPPATARIEEGRGQQLRRQSQQAKADRRVRGADYLSVGRDCSKGHNRVPLVER